MRPIINTKTAGIFHRWNRHLTGRPDKAKIMLLIKSMAITKDRLLTIVNDNSNREKATTLALGSHLQKMELLGSGLINISINNIPLLFTSSKHIVFISISQETSITGYYLIGAVKALLSQYN